MYYYGRVTLFPDFWCFLLMEYLFNDDMFEVQVVKVHFNGFFSNPFSTFINNTHKASTTFGSAFVSVAFEGETTFSGSEGSAIQVSLTNGCENLNCNFPSTKSLVEKSRSFPRSVKLLLAVD